LNRSFKKFIKIIAGVLIIFLILAGAGLFYLSRGLQEGAAMEVAEVTVLPEDGIYTGSHEHGRWDNKVSVTISEGRIAEIELIEDVQIANRDVAPQIFERVKESQSLNVDTVAGATVTSKAYLQAIADALSY